MTGTITRRSVMKTAAGAGLGFASVVRMSAQSPDPIPTWKRELRQLAPNVYAYMLGGGPGQLAQGVLHFVGGGGGIDEGDAGHGEPPEWPFRP